MTKPLPEPLPSGPSVVVEVMDTLYALIRVIEEESERLAVSGPVADIAELALAKARLAGRLDEIGARQARENPRWIEALPEGERGALMQAIEELNRAAVVNSDVLERQIDLSSELLGAVGKELERLTGRRARTYGRRGKVRQAHAQIPLSINTRL
ncbi:flagellar protein FlgN [Sphingobium subterraneum]|uniref:Flagellar biosynthesis/type III secretory pathway chaperone n=1 Tax=Sphingobium subterraneum TaxID=627688 RepID=A0A841J107_9SPHN|nr:flagellar protein FlgN [Sphingobium subterraneum]MBB6124320.1 flagellar biosynthesis/type III secretory pathway chaperone [Sphingobium subterraneum]